MGQFSTEEPSKAISEINTTPFVDVMLVLLIIFIITAPLMSQGLPLSLPQTNAPSLPASTTIIRVDITAQGDIFIDGQALEGTPTALETAIAQKALSTGPDTPLQIRADGATAYARVAEVIAQAQAAGLRQIGLVTTPAPPGGGRPGSGPASRQTQ